MHLPIKMIHIYATHPISMPTNSDFQPNVAACHRVSFPRGPRHADTDVNRGDGSGVKSRRAASLDSVVRGFKCAVEMISQGPAISLNHGPLHATRFLSVQKWGHGMGSIGKIGLGYKQ